MSWSRKLETNKYCLSEDLDNYNCNISVYSDYCVADYNYECTKEQFENIINKTKEINIFEEKELMIGKLIKEFNLEINWVRE